MKAAFRDYVHQDFNRWRFLNPDRPTAEWKPSLSLGALKPHMTGFVATALTSLSTPEFSETIRNAFAIVGRFAEMRSEARQAQAAADALAARLEGDLAIVPDGEELFDAQPVINLLALNNCEIADADDDSDDDSVPGLESSDSSGDESD